MSVIILFLVFWYLRLLQEGERRICKTPEFTLVSLPCLSRRVHSYHIYNIQHTLDLALNTCSACLLDTCRPSSIFLGSELPAFLLDGVQHSVALFSNWLVSYCLSPLTNGTQVFWLVIHQLEYHICKCYYYWLHVFEIHPRTVVLSV